MSLRPIPTFLRSTLLAGLFAVAACGDSGTTPTPDTTDTTDVTPQPDVTPEVTPEPDVTPEVTPEPDVTPDTVEGVCGDGVLDEGEDCDDGEANSDTAPNACRTDCTLPACGDGVIDDTLDEVCDGDNLGMTTCVDLDAAAWIGGTLGCASDCLTFDTSGCDAVSETCGDGNLDEGEECDGENLDGATCESLGLGEGMLSCTSTCLLDASLCVCAEDDFSPNHAVAEAAELAPGQYEDLAICPDADDYFAIEVCAGGTLSVTVSFVHDDGNLDAFLLDVDGNVVATGDSETDEEVVSFTNSGAEMVVVTLRVTGVSGASNDYALDASILGCLTFDPCEGNPCGDTPPASACNDAGTAIVTFSGPATCTDVGGLASCSWEQLVGPCEAGAACEGNVAVVSTGLCAVVEGSPVCTTTSEDCGTDTCVAGVCVGAVSCEVEHIDGDLGSMIGEAVATGTTVGAGANHTGSCTVLGTGPAEDRAYTWSAPTDGCFVFDTVGSDFDTVLYLKSCAGSNEIACNDDAFARAPYPSISPLSRIFRRVTAGETFAVVVDGYQVEGDYTLNITESVDPCLCGLTCNTPPANACNDDLSAVLTYSATGTCDSSSGEAVCAYNETVTSCVTPPANGCTGSVYREYADVAGACNPDSLACDFTFTEVDCADSGSLCTPEGCVAPAAGAACSAPLDVDYGTNEFTGNFTENLPTGTFTCGSSFGGHTNSVWFRFTATSSGFHDVQLQNRTGTNAWSRIAVLEGEDCDPLGAELTCDDPGNVNVDTSVELVEGQTYLIAAWTDGNSFTMIDPILTIALGTEPPVCEADQFGGDNNSIENAAPVTEGVYGDLQMCDGASAFFTVDLCPRGTIDIEILFSHSDADLDLYLSDEDGGITSSESASDNERIIWTNDGDETVPLWIEVDRWSGGLEVAYAMTIAITGCVDPTSACFNNPCDDLPAGPVCTDDNSGVLTRVIPGTCTEVGEDDYTCDYDETIVTCDTPPADGCVGSVFTQYAAGPGSCDDDTAACVYASTEVDCAATGDLCTAGGCVAPSMGQTCETAEVVEVGVNYFNGDYTEDIPGDTFSCGTEDGVHPNSVWFSFTAEVTGTHQLFLTNEASLTYSRLAVVEGASCDPLGAELRCAAPSTTNVTTTASFIAGQEYRIAAFSDGQIYPMLNPTLTIDVLCEDDAFEPNDSIDEAPLVAPGLYEDLSICAGNLDYFAIEVCAGGSVTVDAYFEHASGDIDLYLRDEAAALLDSSGSVDDNEQVQWTNDGEQTVTVYAHLRLFGSSLGNSYDLEITVEGCAHSAEWDFIETFDNRPVMTTSGYGDFTFDGVVPVGAPLSWSVVRGRHENGHASTELFPIDGAGIMLQHAGEPSSLTASFPDGVSSVLLDVRKAHTNQNERRVELVLRKAGEDDVVLDSLVFAATSGEDDTTVRTLGADDVNATGPATLIVRIPGTDTTNRQVTLDNFRWNAYSAD